MVRLRYSFFLPKTRSFFSVPLARFFSVTKPWSVRSTLATVHTGAWAAADARPPRDRERTSSIRMGRMGGTSGESGFVASLAGKAGGGKQIPNHKHQITNKSQTEKEGRSPKIRRVRGGICWSRIMIAI